MAVEAKSTALAVLALNGGTTPRRRTMSPCITTKAITTSTSSTPGG